MAETQVPRGEPVRRPLVVTWRVLVVVAGAVAVLGLLAGVARLLGTSFGNVVFVATVATVVVWVTVPATRRFRLAAPEPAPIENPPEPEAAPRSGPLREAMTALRDPRLLLVAATVGVVLGWLLDTFRPIG